MIVADVIFVVVALIGAVFGSITDLKSRWVPDWSNYSLIFIGIGGHVIVSILEVSFKPILYSLAGAGLFFLIAAAMFYGGAWGGGDTKLFIGLGALLPIYPLFLMNHVSPAIAPWPFLVTMWLNILIMGVIFGLLAITWIAIRYRQKVIRGLVKDFKKYRKIGVYAISASLIGGIITGFALDFSFLILFFILATLVPILFLTKTVEKVCMYKIIPPSKLVEGDWIANEIKIWGKTIYKPKRYGIEQKDIDRLIKLEKSGKLKHIKIKEGLPYVPAILAGILFSLIFGDMLYIIVGGLL